jgi:transposase
MKRFIEGDNRHQTTLFPHSLDDYVTDDNPIRVIDAFVDELQLGRLGFHGAKPQATGRPAYHPSIMLKIYIYGYLNRIQSSRRLEREAQRNIELMWLTGRLAPDFKTIADFRKDNGPAIVKVCREFIKVCHRLNLFTRGEVAIDGSKFKAVNSGDKNFTANRIKRRKEGIEKHIARYLKDLDEADLSAKPVPEGKTDRLKEKLVKLKAEMRRIKKLEAQLSQSPDGQLSLTDPDARVMATQRRNSGLVGYNMQAAVDTKHHIIVTHKVTNQVTDRRQLTPMAKQSRQAMRRKKLKVLADRGYFAGEEIVKCHRLGIKAFVPKSQTSGNRAVGLFSRDMFKYEGRHDQYRCPAGERLIYRMTTIDRGMTMHKYWSSSCPYCSMKPQCTTGKYRRMARWEHEAVIEKMEQALEKDPHKMSVRRQTVEHTFGTLKSWMGSTHFLTKTLEHVSTEMSLHVLAYNLKRVMGIVGINPLIRAISA